MREQKGKSLLIFPSDYTVIDIETTGLSPEYDDIIEISALKYRNKELTEKFSTLVNPTYEISDFITQLTGITNEMLAPAPIISDVLPQFLDFLGDDIMVGHNIHFDINFLYDNSMQHLSKPLSNDFVDTLRIARLLYKENKHNRLCDLAKQFDLSYDNAHRAEFDCLLTNNILSIFENEFKDKYGDEANLSSLLSHTPKAGDITTTNTEFDITNPIYDKTVVFTGALEKMVRQDAMQIVVDLGGINGNGVTKKTNYLVLGNNDYCSTIKDGKSSKQKKAEEYKLQGYDIEIIPENVFYDMVDLPSLDIKPKSSKTHRDTSGLLMQDTDFTIYEIECFKLIKQILSSAGADISYLRCKVNSANELVISALYNVLKIKLRGKKYIKFDTSIDLTTFDSKSHIIDYEKGRINIESYQEVVDFSETIIERYNSCVKSTEKYLNKGATAKKDVNHYLATNYTI